MNESELLIRTLAQRDIQPIAAAFAGLGWNKPASQYEKYLAEQQLGQRVMLVAFLREDFAGYVTICWLSDYPPFLAANIPEIVDFNVLPRFRRRGIGSSLMDAAEAWVSAYGALVGIGVGLSADYGAAQRMYARRGYLPDGRGLMSAGNPAESGKPVMVDDDLCLYFTKNLPGTPSP